MFFADASVWHWSGSDKGLFIKLGRGWCIHETVPSRNMKGLFGRRSKYQPIAFALQGLLYATRRHPHIREAPCAKQLAACSHAWGIRYALKRLSKPRAMGSERLDELLVRAVIL